MPKNCVTHSGTFHSDDVYGVALMQLLNPEIKVTRSRNEAIIAAAELAFDVGALYDPNRLRFDHHQNDAPVRPNGIKYCGFGQMWQFYGLQVCDGDKVAWQNIDTTFVQQIDAIDNGVTLFSAKYDGTPANLHPYDASELIDSFNPPKDYEYPPTAQQYDTQFFKAVAHAKEILQNIIAKSLVNSKNMQIARKMLSERPNPEYVVFDNLVPLGSLPDEFPELLYSVAYNSAADSWKVTAIHDSDKQFTNRLSFPEAWGGLRDTELQAVTGLKTAQFCHVARFLFVAGDKADAIAAVELSLKQIK